MRTLTLSLLALLASLPMAAQKSRSSASAPRLVVGVVLDQMRPDMLYRYQARYSDRGFMRLMRGGNVCENAFISYLPSFTAPGHACIYTGSVPVLHGIASNDWIDRQSGKPVYCTEDATVSSVGGTQRAGRMSPRNLWANTITDELRLHTQMASKVIAVSVKDRAAILPGGHSANAAYWMDDSNGVFMSSTFYMKELPNWVQEFNRKGLARQYMDRDWNTLYPVSTYTASTADSTLYEGKFSGETAPVFPHRNSALRNNDIKRTPYGNDIVLDFAMEALTQEKLGADAVPDFLAISFSSTDYIGHMYGPDAVETEDTYLRMDKTIADLLDFLDREVGEGAYTLFLTSDHGVAHNPQFLADRRVASGFFFGTPFRDELNAKLQTRFKQGALIREVSDNYVWLSDSVLQATGINRQAVVDEILQLMKASPEVHFAVDVQHIEQAGLPAQLRELALNGTVRGRSGDILLLLKPGWLDAYSRTGSTHGTWNPYDTHIPLLWYGWGIQPGQTRRVVHMADIAPTLSTLLHIQWPNACVGQPIPEVLR